MILLTFETLLAGPTLARCAFTGPNWTPDGQTDGTYIYTYKEDFAEQYDKCGARSGSSKLLIIIGTKLFIIENNMH